MSKFTEAIEVMKRIEDTEGGKEGKMVVKGTIIMDGNETIHSSFDNTMTVTISRSLFPFTDICNNCIRTMDPTDKVEFIKLNFANRTAQNEVLLAPDGDFQAIVVQQHPIRDFRQRQRNKRTWKATDMSSKISSSHRSTEWKRRKNNLLSLFMFNLYKWN